MSKRSFSEEEIINVTFDDGTEKCGVLGLLDMEGREYIALQSLKDDEMYIYRFKLLDDTFEMRDIEDDAEFNRAAELFDRLMEQEENNA